MWKKWKGGELEEEKAGAYSAENKCFGYFTYLRVAANAAICCFYVYLALR